MMKEYKVRDIIDVKYQNRRVKVKILDINKLNGTIELLINDEKVLFNVKILN